MIYERTGTRRDFILAPLSLDAYFREARTREARTRKRVLERRVLEREYCIYFMEVYPSNFVLLNFGKYFRKICLKNKHTESTKNLTRYSVTYLKMVLLTSLILRKFSKITRIFV